MTKSDSCVQYHKYAVSEEASFKLVLSVICNESATDIFQITFSSFCAEFDNAWGKNDGKKNQQNRSDCKASFYKKKLIKIMVSEIRGTCET